MALQSLSESPISGSDYGRGKRARLLRMRQNEALDIPNITLQNAVNSFRNVDVRMQEGGDPQAIGIQCRE